MGLKKPFKLGKITLPSNIFCAPLAGCSDLPFRFMTSRYRPALVFCEMVKMDALVRGDLNTYRILDYTGDMHPIGAQLCGSKIEYAGPCARIIEDLGFDVIDLNCGCPVDKVTKDGSGSGLLKEPAKIGELIYQIKSRVNIPVTVKVRAGWDEASINAPEIVRIAESAGADAIFVHGRTRAQGYKGPANRDHIAACKAAAKNILVIGNGDVFDASSARHMFETTQSDGILIARGTFGAPWLIEDIERDYDGLPPIVRGWEAYKEALCMHLDAIYAYRSEKRAVTDVRRVGSWFLKNGKGAKKLREQINTTKSLDQIKQYIADFPWETIDFTSPPESSLEDLDCLC